MNLDLKNFHLGSATSSSLQPRSPSLSGFPQAAWSPAYVHHSAIPGMKGNAGDRLGGAGSASTAATARESIPRLTAPFPPRLDFVPAAPPLGGEGDSTDGQGTPSVMSVHSSNK